ncbi:MAG: trypsin-like peptidase domain-containing protein [Actinomycetota bacterium]
MAGTALLAGAACSDAPATAPDHTEPSAAAIAPTLDDALARAVAIETGTCGAANPADGTGIALGTDVVLTAAHVVASGGPITIRSTDGEREADVAAYDPRRDLALLTPRPPLTAVPPPPPMLDLAEGQAGTIALAAGSVPASVVTVTIVEIDDVRATTRSRRRGYIVDARTVPGNSGAGFYDDHGRLAGVVFAVSSEDADRSWVTAASEVDAFLSDTATRGSFRCDPEASRLAPAR